MRTRGFLKTLTGGRRFAAPWGAWRLARMSMQGDNMTKSFEELGLPENVLKAVADLGYESPTPVQEQAIPLIMQGRDVCAAAATGTGKTAAFLLPALAQLDHAVTKKARISGPHLLVVTPTRELAQQIGEVCHAISRRTRHFQATVYGGTKYGPQINKLKRGVDVLIATPGRLNDLVERGVADLSDIDVLVIDEADRLLDMGFWPDMEKLIGKTPVNRQTLLFSATLGRKVMKSVSPILRDPVMVEIAHHGETAKTVEQRIIPIPNKKKQDLLQALLRERPAERVIVFCRTKARTEDCMIALRDAGFSAESIHSDKTQAKRQRALDRFAAGKSTVIAATDVLARGIDVPEVDYVVNFDLPDMADDYVHRIGRTGRAGQEGLAISFVTRESKRELAAIEKLIGRTLPFMSLETYKTDRSLLEPGKNQRTKKRRQRQRDIERARAHKERCADKAQARAARRAEQAALEGRSPASAGHRDGGMDFGERNLSHYERERFLEEFEGVGGWKVESRQGRAFGKGGAPKPGGQSRKGGAPTPRAGGRAGKSGARGRAGGEYEKGRRGKRGASRASGAAGAHEALSRESRQARYLAAYANAQLASDGWSGKSGRPVRGGMHKKTFKAKRDGMQTRPKKNQAHTKKRGPGAYGRKSGSYGRGGQRRAGGRGAQ